jgi:hypothetical protein
MQYLKALRDKDSDRFLTLLEPQLPVLLLREASFNQQSPSTPKAML